MKRLRIFALALAAVLLVPSPAAAQKAPAQESRPPVREQNQAPADPAIVEAVRDVYHAMLFDSGAFSQMMESFVPMYRTDIRQSEFYRRSNQRRRAALDALAERTPDILREIIVSEIDLMSAPAAARLAESVHISEIAAFARIMRSPAFAPIIRRLTDQVVSGAPDVGPIISPEEEERLLAELDIGADRDGALDRLDFVMNALADEMDAAGPRLETRISETMGVEICRVLGDDCPPEMQLPAREI